MLTPTFPKVRVLDISGLMQTRSLRCCGWRIQSSQNLEIECSIRIRDKFTSKIRKQSPEPRVLFEAESFTYAFGHFTDSSFHSSFVNIQPRPGKKSLLYNKLEAPSSILPTLPLSFHADTHLIVNWFIDAISVSLVKSTFLTTATNRFSAAHAFPESIHKNLGTHSNHLKFLMGWSWELRIRSRNVRNVSPSTMIT